MRYASVALYCSVLHVLISELKNASSDDYQRPSFTYGALYHVWLTCTSCTRLQVTEAFRERVKDWIRLPRQSSSHLRERHSD